MDVHVYYFNNIWRFKKRITKKNYKNGNKIIIFDNLKKNKQIIYILLLKNYQN